MSTDTHGRFLRQSVPGMGEVLPFLQSRRRHPRVSLTQPVALVHENATVATSLCTNISGGGIQVVCDRYTADSLHPSSRRITDKNAPRVHAHFMLPVRTGLAKLDCECAIAYLTPYDDSRFAFGLEFLLVAEASRSSLSGFLDDAVEFEED